MNKQVVLKISKLEDIRREDMYHAYLLLLAKKKKQEERLAPLGQTGLRPNRRQA